ncbi:MAG TPA: UbiA family prenyltransferase [Candidatus Limnocylindrales bacterium]|nr:UbiA family prenyltransferase [Candidatus Limnocylindrales bacterium]
MKYRYYLKAFRLDHWFKNLFTLTGSLAALSYFNRELPWDLLSKILTGLLLACLVSSVNYAINEILDASYDLQHPVKRFRPIPSGLVDIQTLVILTLGLLLVSLSLAFYFFNPYFQFSLIGLFLAGMIYNLRPLRAKEIPYIDVLSESINNPIRLLIGWFSVTSERILPPFSLILWLWVFGAFLMTAKRLAELLFLGSQAVFYRRAYKYYSKGSLLGVMIFYAGLTMLGYVYLALQFQRALFFTLPFFLIFILWFFILTLKSSPLVKEPERIFTEPLFCIYSLVLFLIMIFLCFR